MAVRARLRDDDPADAVARVAIARQPLLLRVHRHQLSAEDLEDCLSQATMELVSRARANDRAFASDAHIANALDQKLTSRIADRRRALEGRSAKEAAFRAALGANASSEEQEPVIDRVADPRPSVEDQVQARLTLAQLREVARELTPDQRLVLAAQNIGMSCAEFCARFPWSADKFRKTAQRMRGKLVALVARHDAGEICLARRGDLIALISETATEAERERAQLHLAACPGCVRMVSDAAIAARRIGALLPPLPALRDDDAPNRLVAIFGHLRRLLPGGAEHADAAVAAKAGAAGAAGAAAGGSSLAGGGLAGAGALKLGVVALCAAGTVGGTVAVCERAGVLQGDRSYAIQRQAPKHAATPRHRARVSAAAHAPAPVTAAIVSPSPTTAAVTHPASTTNAPRRATSSSSTSTASNEFGFEGAGGSPAGSSGASSTPVARSASTSVPSSTSSPTTRSSAPAAPSKAASSEFGFEGG